MKNVMGVIYTGEKDSFLRELTLLRAIAAMPVAGRYRVIDFLVSSMVGSGMRNVGVIMQKNYHSLMDHLGSGKEWDLHGKNDGLYILPPFLTRDNVGVYTGSLDALHSNMNYLRRSRQEYVLLCNSLIIFNANFTDMFKSYLDSGCDVMMLYTKDPEMQRPEYGTYLDIDPTGKVIDIEIDPTKPRYENTSMDVILLRKDLLIDLVDRGAAHGYHDLVRDVLQRMARDAGLNLCGYEYKDICWTACRATSSSTWPRWTPMCATVCSRRISRYTPRCATSCPPGIWTMRGCSIRWWRTAASSTAWWSTACCSAGSRSTRARM